MAVYQTSEEFQAVLQEGFLRMGADPAALSDFQKRRMTVVLKTNDPALTVTIDGRATPTAVSFGEPPARGDLMILMKSDLLHDILMDRASVKSSFLSGAVQVTGNVFRAMQLGDLFHQIQRVYPQVRNDIGYSELG